VKGFAGGSKNGSESGFKASTREETMTKNTEPSPFELLMKAITKAAVPVSEANRLSQQMNVRSLEDTCGALKESGYQIVRADLPSAVRGFAQVICGQPYIVTNRCDCCDQHRYTVAHELGHHVLHVNPSPAITELGLPAENLEDREFRANQFATAWFTQTATPEQQERFFQKDPELSFKSDDPMMGVVFMILSFAILYVCVRLFSKISPA
jgi:hypothetical protein